MGKNIAVIGGFAETTLQETKYLVRINKIKAWTPYGGPVLGAGGEPKEYTNRFTLSHAEVV